MKALILVDLQNDFLPGGALPVANGNVILPIINQIQKKFSLVIATKDFHPPNHISFTTSHPHSSVGDCVSTSNGPQIIWPIHCVQGTKGSEFSPFLIQVLFIPFSIKAHKLTLIAIVLFLIMQIYTPQD